MHEAATTAKSPTDEQILTFENEIKEQIARDRPILGPLMPAGAALLEEYQSSDNVNFLSKIAEISNSYEFVRYTRGDGNCFYRAFSAGMIESLLRLNASISDTKDRAIDEPRIHQVLETVKETLGRAPFELMAYEDFYDDLVFHLTKSCWQSTDELAMYWSDNPHSSHALVVVLRLLVSAHLRMHAEEYVPFLVDANFEESPMDQMADFCQKHVECMGVESDQIHIIALANCLGCKVTIAYLDGTEGPLSLLDFASDKQNPPSFSVHLLYRPGHYDLLYPLPKRS